jgi:hypothetical protein
MFADAAIWLASVGIVLSKAPTKLPHCKLIAPPDGLLDAIAARIASRVIALFKSLGI